MDGQRVHRAAVALSLKYEDVYLKGYTNGREARIGIGAWIAFYNGRRPHQALGQSGAQALPGRSAKTLWT
jgi:hypothetical protein